MRTNVETLVENTKVKQDAFLIACARKEFKAQQDSLTFRELTRLTAVELRKQGFKFTQKDITEAALQVRKHSILCFVKHIKENHDSSQKVNCIIRRWLDKLNGSCYFSCRVAIPMQNQPFSEIIYIPMQYGSNAAPEWEAIHMLARIGLWTVEEKLSYPREFNIDFKDQGYGKKNMMFIGSYL